MRWHRSKFPMLVAVLACVSCGCATSNAPDKIRLRPETKRPDKAVVIFFVDGLERELTRELLADGHLPNIERHFHRGGVRVENAVTGLPSLTYPNTVSIFTGRFPGNHGILGNQWFDRNSLQYQDYITPANYTLVNEDFSCPSLYDILDDQFTINIQCPTHRNVKCTFDHWAETGIDWFFTNYKNVDARVGHSAPEVVRTANRVGRWPTVWFTYYPGVDQIGHVEGPRTAEYVSAIKNIDNQIGRIFDAVETLGLSDRTYFVLVTDHGHVSARKEKLFDIVKWLKKHCGIHISEGSTFAAAYADRVSYTNKYDAIVVNGAHRRLAIHLKGTQGWSKPATQEDVDRFLRLGCHEQQTSQPSEASTDFVPELCQQPGVALICLRRGPDRVQVMSCRGSVIVERRGAPLQPEYRLVSPSTSTEGKDTTPVQLDTLEYRNNATLAKFVETGWHTSREWLAATAAEEYPDFVPQVVEMFDSPRAGDIVVFAERDWTLKMVEPGGHGSCVAQDMHIPMYFAGPDLPPGGSISSARLVDVMPTVVDLLGHGDRLEHAGPLDGTSLAAPLKAATPNPSLAIK